MRLFISITPPPDITHELIRIQEQVQHKELFQATYTKPKNLHCTVSFLGNIAKHNYNALLHLFKTIEYNTFTVTLANLQLHQEHNSVRAVLLVTVISPELARLAHTLAVQFNQTPRPFLGHITLARVKQLLKSPASVTTALSTINVLTLAWYVTHIELQQSILNQKGPVYTKLASVTLR